jgi:hypothetical protein
MWLRKKAKPVEGAGVLAARAERELSEQRLAEVQPLKRTLREMIEENHVADKLDRLISSRGRGQGDAGPAHN